MGYDELNEHYESLNKYKITKYNNSYDKYLDEHERNIENKFPPIPKSDFNNIKEKDVQDYGIPDFEDR